MYKNQLQELAQRSCFNLPAYSCIREGPDHAPRFKATVNFNGETFESPTFCSTLRQAEHAAAEVALNTLAIRGPSRALAARVLDETGVYKNLLQETAHRAGLKLPVYTTVRSGPGHVPIFKCTVELAGMSFAGEPARTKKQAQKNAAMAAWFALKRLVQHGSSASTSIVSQHGSSSSSASSSLETRRGNEEQEQVIIARFLTSTQPSELKNKQLVSQQIRERFIPVCRELTSSTSNFYPTQSQSWAYPSFSPEMALCHMWQQEQLLHLQPRLLTVQVPPPPFPGPQCLPYMHAILSPDSLFVPTREPEPSPAGPRITITTTRPSLYFSDHLVSDPIGGKSAVTIKEIHEEKPEELSDCLCPDSILLANINAEPRLKELVPEDDKQMNGEQESKAQNLQRTKNHFGQFENPLSSSRDDGYKAADYRAQNPCGFDASPSYVQCPPRPSPSRSFRPPSVARPVMIRSMRPIPLSAPSPVMVRNVGPVSTLPRPQESTPHIHVPPRIRTGIPSHSAGTYPQRMDVGGVHPRFLAPAVRIRSVIPVCAAPQRKNSVPCQEGVLAPRDQADTVPEDIATTGSEFYRLKIQDKNRY